MSARKWLLLLTFSQTVTALTALTALQYELARVTKAHNDVISVYNSKLSEFGIPVDELGFKPLHALTTTAPAGLVVS